MVFRFQINMKNKKQTSNLNFNVQLFLKLKNHFNPCMERIIQKINFLKNENCIFSFLYFWNINLNVIFHFFEIRILISIWVSIKIDTKFEFMQFDCDVTELLSGWQQIFPGKFYKCFIASSLFPAIYDCSKWKFYKLGMKMGMIKSFQFYWHFTFN